MALKQDTKTNYDFVIRNLLAGGNLYRNVTLNWRVDLNWMRNKEHGFFNLVCWFVMCTFFVLFSMRMRWNETERKWMTDRPPQCIEKIKYFFFFILFFFFRHILNHQAWIQLSCCISFRLVRFLFRQNSFIVNTE